MLFYILTGTLDSVINANYAAYSRNCSAATPAGRKPTLCAGISACRHDYQHRIDTMVTNALGYSLTRSSMVCWAEGLFCI